MVDMLSAAGRDARARILETVRRRTGAEIDLQVVSRVDSLLASATQRAGRESVGLERAIEELIAILPEAIVRIRDAG